MSDEEGGLDEGPTIILNEQNNIEWIDESLENTGQS
jgi:hypothetical protein